jgi:hypothetical protein
LTHFSPILTPFFIIFRSADPGKMTIKLRRILQSTLFPDAPIAVGSAKTGAGMGDVMRMIVEMLRKQGARKPPVSAKMVIFGDFYGVLWCFWHKNGIKMV